MAALGKTGAPPTEDPFQLRPPGPEPGNTTELTAIVPGPGVVTPLMTMLAPVGTVARPMVVAFCTFSWTSSVSRDRLSYARPAPARSTVFPVPYRSQAIPNRGANWV